MRSHFEVQELGLPHLLGGPNSTPDGVYCIIFFLFSMFGQFHNGKSKQAHFKAPSSSREKPTPVSLVSILRPPLPSLALHPQPRCSQPSSGLSSTPGPRSLTVASADLALHTVPCSRSRLAVPQASHPEHPLLPRQAQHHPQVCSSSSSCSQRCCAPAPGHCPSRPQPSGP